MRLLCLSRASEVPTPGSAESAIRILLAVALVIPLSLFYYGQLSSLLVAESHSHAGGSVLLADKVDRGLLMYWFLSFLPALTVGVASYSVSFCLLSVIARRRLTLVQRRARVMIVCGLCLALSVNCFYYRVLGMLIIVGGSPISPDVERQFYGLDSPSHPQEFMTCLAALALLTLLVVALQCLPAAALLGGQRSVMAAVFGTLLVTGVVFPAGDAEHQGLSGRAILLRGRPVYGPGKWRPSYCQA